MFLSLMMLILMVSLTIQAAFVLCFPLHFAYSGCKILLGGSNQFNVDRCFLSGGLFGYTIVRPSKLNTFFGSGD